MEQRCQDNCIITPRDTRRLVLKAIFIQKKGVSPNFWNTNLCLVSSIFHALRRVLLAAIGNAVWFIFRIPDRGIRAARFCLGLNVQDQLCMKSWQSWRMGSAYHLIPLIESVTITSGYKDVL